MKKKPVAFMTRSLVDATGQNMWRGIIAQCKDFKMPIFTFRGPVLNQGAGSILYQIVDPSTFSGLMSWATSDVTKDAIDYYLRFRSLPLVCMTFQIPGKPVIVMDCVSGMKDLMEHLIKVHGYKKIAFIRGPENHVYAKERYSGYLESLKENNIAINQRIISPCGGWSPDEGARQIASMLEQGIKPKQDFEAVVCVGDNVAIGVQDQLIAKGYQVPNDVAVCGYNGSDDAASMNPPLTTVNMPFFEQGRQTVLILKDIQEGKTPKEKYLYKTKLIISQSCGCHSQSAIKAGLYNKNNSQDFSNLPPLKRLFAKNKNTTQQKKQITPLAKQQLIDTLQKTVAEYRYYSPKINEFFLPVINTLVNEIVLECEKQTGTFINTLDIAIRASIPVLKDLVFWQDIISSIRPFAEEYTKDIGYMSALMSQARVIINETAQRTQKKRALILSRMENQLRQTASALLATSDMGTLMDAVCKQIPKLKIQGLYIVLYKDCQYTQENKNTPKISRLILAVRDGKRLPIKEGGQEFDTKDILPQDVLPQQEFYSMVVESLHFQKTFLGYVVFQHKEEDPAIFVALRDYLSSSIFASMLERERSKVGAVLEDTLKAMSQKVDIVSHHSKEVTKTVSKVSKSVDLVAQNIKEVSANISNVLKTVQESRGNITQTSTSVKDLINCTKKITSAVGSITDIAQKTNVLALNATIEAAHAGDAGQGFRVVASSVKDLALQTVTSTNQITDIVNENDKITGKTASLIAKTNAAIDDITRLSTDVMNFVSGQVEATQKASSLLSNAALSVAEIDAAIQEIADLGNKKLIDKQ